MLPVGCRRMPELSGVGDPLDAIREIEENAYVLTRLENQVQQGRGVVPFVGAGVSIPFGLLGWGDFLLDQGRLAGVEAKIGALLSQGGYEEAAELLLAARGYRRFQNSIDQAYGDERLRGAVFAQSAAEAICRLAVGPIVTTNFDHVLEYTANEIGCPVEAVWGAKVDLAAEAVHTARRMLLKLHGDVRDSTDRVLTLSDYERAYGSAEPATTNLAKDLPARWTYCSVPTPSSL
jgi:hypothetical protein